MAKKKTKHRDRKEEYFTRQMPCQLTSEDYAARGEELGKEPEGLAMAKSAAKQDVAMHKSTIAGHEKKVERLGRTLRDGSEERPVRCLRIINYIQGQVTVTRTDTGQVIEERGLLEHERQVELVPARSQAGTGQDEGEAA